MKAPLTQAPLEKPVGRRGYSLIEFIGVLTIISILALVLVQVFVKHADIVTANAEAATLNNFSNAIVLQILRSGRIPDAGSWATTAGNYLALPSASITANSRNYARAYLIDPGGWFGSVTLPYTNNSAGTTINSSARLMIVSSLSAALPVSSGMPSAASFNDIWNTAPGHIPSTWAGWIGRGDDLLIQRLNLQPQFYQLILVNRDGNNAAAFAIGGGSTNLVTAYSIANASYLGGSVVSLLNTNAGTTTVQNTFVLNRNLSFVFEHGTWGGQISTGPPPTIAGHGIGAAYTALSQPFLSEPDSPDNAGSTDAAGDQEQVLAAMNDFMTIYTLWSGDDYTLHGMSEGQAKNHLSLYNYLEASATALDQATGTNRNINTHNPPVYSGLLY